MNSEASRAASRRYREAHPDRVKASGRESDRKYRETHPDRVKESKKKYQDANKDKIRERSSESRRVYQLKRFHHMTPLEYEQMWESQNGCCYLCGDPLVRGRSTHIDHDHACCGAGESCFQCRRGLACKNCNLVVGHAFDDPERLRRIADALERHIIADEQ